MISYVSLEMISAPQQTTRAVPSNPHLQLQRVARFVKSVVYLLIVWCVEHACKLLCIQIRPLWPQGLLFPERRSTANVKRPANQQLERPHSRPAQQLMCSLCDSVRPLPDVVRVYEPCAAR
jgi:hypothetical protein